MIQGLLFIFWHVYEKACFRHLFMEGEKTHCELRFTINVKVPAIIIILIILCVVFCVKFKVLWRVFFFVYFNFWKQGWELPPCHLWLRNQLFKSTNCPKGALLEVTTAGPYMYASISNQLAYPSSPLFLESNQ